MSQLGTAWLGLCCALVEDLELKPGSPNPWLYLILILYMMIIIIIRRRIVSYVDMELSNNKEFAHNVG